MKTVMVSPCEADHIFKMSDPDAPSEVEFEALTLRAFACIYPQYRCVVFGGRFLYDGDYRKPDLAMVARDHSHWFIVEVELVAHSLERHVLPQVRAFQYGTPQTECSSILSRELALDMGEAATLLDRVPRSVVVVANSFQSDWEVALRAHQAQFLVLTRFESPSGREAFEVSGSLTAVKASLGFGVYSASDRMIRFARTIDLPVGLIQIETLQGPSSLWKVIRDQRYTWVVKEVGRLDAPDGAHIQIIRGIDGRISLRL